MALRSCPSCFVEIPDEAKVCPHCHTALKKCTRCGALSLEETHNCSKCGSKFPKHPPLIESPDVSVDTVSAHVNEFKKKNPVLAIISNQTLWSVISVIMMIGGGIMFFLTMNNVNFKEWNASTSLLLLAIVLEFIAYSLKAFPLVVAEAFIPKKLYKYTEQVGFNILPHLANGKVTIPKNGKGIIPLRKLNFDIAKTSEYAKANPAEYTKYMIFNIVRLVAIAVSGIGTLIGAVLMLGFGASIVAGGKNVWTSVPMILEYIFIGFELATSIGISLYMAGYNKARDEWIVSAA